MSLSILEVSIIFPFGFPIVWEEYKTLERDKDWGKD